MDSSNDHPLQIKFVGKFVVGECDSSAIVNSDEFADNSKPCRCPELLRDHPDLPLYQANERYARSYFQTLVAAKEYFYMVAGTELDDIYYLFERSE